MINEVPDDLLRMLVVCCDETLPVESQLVLALKTPREPAGGSAPPGDRHRLNADICGSRPLAVAAWAGDLLSRALRTRRQNAVNQVQPITGKGCEASQSAGLPDFRVAWARGSRTLVQRLERTQVALPRCA